MRQGGRRAPRGDRITPVPLPPDPTMLATTGPGDRGRREVVLGGEVGTGGGPCGTHTLRRTIVHMIEEYARHCGHADLLREAIDGATGD